jgi:hypothetical protein
MGNPPSIFLAFHHTVNRDPLEEAGCIPQDLGLRVRVGHVIYEKVKVDKNIKPADKVRKPEPGLYLVSGALPGL